MTPVQQVQGEICAKVSQPGVNKHLNQNQPRRNCCRHRLCQISLSPHTDTQHRSRRTKGRMSPRKKQSGADQTHQSPHSLQVASLDPWQNWPLSAEQKGCELTPQQTKNFGSHYSRAWSLTRTLCKAQRKGNKPLGFRRLALMRWFLRQLCRHLFQHLVLTRNVFSRKDDGLLVDLIAACTKARARLLFFRQSEMHCHSHVPQKRNSKQCLPHHQNAKICGFVSTFALLHEECVSRFCHWQAFDLGLFVSFLCVCVANKQEKEQEKNE